MGEEHYSEIYPGYPETNISKPPRPWSADIVTFNKRMQGAPEVPEYRTTRSETSHEKTSDARYYEARNSSDCCVYECRNPPNTPVNPKHKAKSQMAERQFHSFDETRETSKRCSRLRLVSHSAPPHDMSTSQNFRSHWDPLHKRHPGSAFDIVSSSSASSSRTSTPDTTVSSRGESCVNYTTDIIRPVPLRCSVLQKPKMLPDDDSDKDETLPDRLFKAHAQQVAHHDSIKKSIQLMEDDNEQTLPDRLFAAHMKKIEMENETRPRIISTPLKPTRNALKDKFVSNIIENLDTSNDSNILKQLSNMTVTNVPKKNKRKGLFKPLKKTWSSILNLAVGVPDPAVTSSTSLGLGPRSKMENHRNTLYTESMYSSLVGDIYKSRSTACIAAL